MDKDKLKKILKENLNNPDDVIIHYYGKRCIDKIYYMIRGGEIFDISGGREIKLNIELC